MKIEPKLTARLQKILKTDFPFVWELIPAHSSGGHTWSDFKSREWGSCGRPLAVTPLDGVFVIAHFNENVFRQFSFGVSVEKPVHHFAELSNSGSPNSPYDYDISSTKHDGRYFSDLVEYGEAVIAIRSESQEKPY